MTGVTMRDRPIGRRKRPVDWTSLISSRLSSPDDDAGEVVVSCRLRRAARRCGASDDQVAWLVTRTSKAAGGQAEADRLAHRGGARRACMALHADTKLRLPGSSAMDYGTAVAAGVGDSA